MFRLFISLAIAGVLAGCSQQQAQSPLQVQTDVLDVPAALAHAEAPEGWIVRQGQETGSVKVLTDDGEQITELPRVEMVSVRGNEIAMDVSGSRDL